MQHGEHKETSFKNMKPPNGSEKVWFEFSCTKSCHFNRNPCKSGISSEWERFPHAHFEMCSTHPTSLFPRGGAIRRQTIASSTLHLHQRASSVPLQGKKPQDPFLDDPLNYCLTCHALKYNNILYRKRSKCKINQLSSVWKWLRRGKTVSL